MNINLQKTYYEDRTGKIIHYFYENKDKDLILRKIYNIGNNISEDVYLNDFLKIIIKFETNGEVKFPKLKFTTLKDEIITSYSDNKIEKYKLNDTQDNYVEISNSSLDTCGIFGAI